MEYVVGISHLVFYSVLLLSAAKFVLKLDSAKGDRYLIPWSECKLLYVLCSISSTNFSQSSKKGNQNFYVNNNGEFSQFAFSVSIEMKQIICLIYHITADSPGQSIHLFVFLLSYNSAHPFTCWPSSEFWVIGVKTCMVLSWNSWIIMFTRFCCYYSLGYLSFFKVYFAYPSCSYHIFVFLMLYCLGKYINSKFNQFCWNQLEESLDLHGLLILPSL